MRQSRNPEKLRQSADAAADTAAFLAAGGKIDSRGHGETAQASAKKQTVADRARGHAAVMQSPGKVGRNRKIVQESL